MNENPKYVYGAGFHWDQLLGSLLVACMTLLAISFDHVFSLYDTALETERLLIALLRDGATYGEVLRTGPPGQGLIAILVKIGDGAVGRVLPGEEITHSTLRVLMAAWVTHKCLSMLLKGSRWSPPNAPRIYSISFTLLVALGPFALLVSQVGVSTMICLAITTHLLRVVFGLVSQREHVRVWAPIYVLIILVFAGWPGVMLSLLLCFGCLAQAMLSSDGASIVSSGVAILLVFGIAIAFLTWPAGWPMPARTWAMPHVLLAMGLPLIVVAGTLFALDILRTGSNLQWLTLPIVVTMALVVLSFYEGGNLLTLSALLMLAYTTMWAMGSPSFVNLRDDPDYRYSEAVWAIVAWLIGPLAAIAAYALSEGAVWSGRTIGFSILFWAFCLAALAFFLRTKRRERGSLSALILTSFGAALFVGGVSGMPLRESYRSAPMDLAQLVWSLCRDGEKPLTAVHVGLGIDRVTQRHLGPARRSSISGVDVLHIRLADDPAPEGAIDLVQMFKPGPYIAAIAAPSEAARARCGRG